MVLDAMVRRYAFAGLAGLAGLAILTAILVIVLAVDSVLVWLVTCLIVLALVVVAEIVLLLVDRHESIVEDEIVGVEGPADETIDFVIDGETPRS